MDFRNFHVARLKDDFLCVYVYTYIVYIYVFDYIYIYIRYNYTCIHTHTGNKSSVVWSSYLSNKGKLGQVARNIGTIFVSLDAPQTETSEKTMKLRHVQSDTILSRCVFCSVLWSFLDVVSSCSVFPHLPDEGCKRLLDSIKSACALCGTPSLPQIFASCCQFFLKKIGRI